MIPSRLRLLCAFDGSEPSKAGIRAAGALLAPADATILTVRANPPLTDIAVQGRLALPSAEIAQSLHQLDEELSRTAHATAEEGAALAASCGLQATTSVLRSDRPWRAIEAAAAGHDVIVCGTRGHGPVGRALLGSTASSLLSRASRPLLVAACDAPTPDGPLLVAHDGSDAATAALCFAAVRARDRELVVASAWRSPIRHSLEAHLLANVPVDEVGQFAADYEALFRRSAEERARDGVELAESLGARAHWRTPESLSPWRALLAVADDEGAAAVVCGAGHTGLVPSALTGSVSSRIVHHATRPVLVVPHVVRRDGRGADSVAIASPGQPIQPGSRT